LAADLEQPSVAFPQTLTLRLLLSNNVGGYNLKLHTLDVCKYKTVMLSLNTDDRASWREIRLVWRDERKREMWFL
jgi:hypothetical protein